MPKPWESPLKELKRCVYEVLDETTDDGSPISVTDSHSGLMSLCTSLDACFAVGLRAPRERDVDSESYTTFFGELATSAFNYLVGRQTEYPPLTCLEAIISLPENQVRFLAPDRIIASTEDDGQTLSRQCKMRALVDTIKSTMGGLLWTKADSPMGRWRLILRACLLRGFLPDFIIMLSSFPSITKQFYDPSAAIFLSESAAEVFLSLARTLCSMANFDLDLQNCHFLHQTWLLGTRFQFEMVPTTDIFGICVEYVEDIGVNGFKQNLVQILVIRLVPNSVASDYTKFLSAGDVIDEINGQSTKRLTRAAVTKIFREGQTLPVKLSVVKASLLSPRHVPMLVSKPYWPVRDVWKRCRSFRATGGVPENWNDAGSNGSKLPSSAAVSLPPEARLAEWDSFEKPVHLGDDAADGKACYRAAYLGSVDVGTDKRLATLTGRLNDMVTSIERESPMSAHPQMLPREMPCLLRLTETSVTVFRDPSTNCGSSSLTGRSKSPASSDKLVNSGDDVETGGATAEDDPAMLDDTLIVRHHAYTEISCTGKAAKPLYFAYTARADPSQEKFVCHIFKAINDEDATKIVFTLAQGFERTHWLF